MRKTYTKRRFLKTKHRKDRTKTKRSKRKSRTFKGGFFSDANYFIQKGVSFMSVDPPAAFGNPTMPVPPFPYFQNK